MYTDKHTLSAARQSTMRGVYCICGVSRYVTRMRLRDCVSVPCVGTQPARRLQSASEARPMNTERPGRLAHDCPHSLPFDARRTIKHTSRRPSRQGDRAISLPCPIPLHNPTQWHVGLLGGLSSRWSAIRRATAQRKRCRLRFAADELRRDGCHRKPPQHWAPLTSTLVPRSLSEVRWRRQGSWSTSRGPRSAHCREALCADLLIVQGLAGLAQA